MVTRSLPHALRNAAMSNGGVMLLAKVEWRFGIAGAAGHVVQGLASPDWARMSAGEGIEGARLHDRTYLELADLDIADHDASRSGLWTRGLLVRREIAGGAEICREPAHHEDSLAFVSM